MLRLQTAQLCGIFLEMIGLASHRRLPVDSEPFEIFVDRFLVFRLAARQVDIFDAQQKARTHTLGLFEVENGGQRVPEM